MGLQLCSRRGLAIKMTGSEVGPRRSQELSFELLFTAVWIEAALLSSFEQRSMYIAQMMLAGSNDHEGLLPEDKTNLANHRVERFQ